MLAAPRRIRDLQDGLISHMRAIAIAEPAKRFDVWRHAAIDMAGAVRKGFLDPGEYAAKLTEIAGNHDLDVQHGHDAIQQVLIEALEPPGESEERPHLNEHATASASPPDDGRQPRGEEVRPPDLAGVVLTVDEWRDRDLPPPDKLLGEWLTTTSRVILNAATGLGKTNFAMAIAAHAAAGVDFMHWKSHRAARVLFIDGEMSRRLLKRRIAECIQRLGQRPAGLYFLSKEDVAGFPPLNTPAGHAIIKQVIAKIGGVDLVVFDNIMSLIIANHRETEAWQQVQPLVAHLTAKEIGQIWIHHTGHDTSHGYGDKSREWTADTVLHLTEQKRDDTDVSFTVEFRKARERTPETRHDFEKVGVALVNDAWECNAADTRSKPSPLGEKFLDALRVALTDTTTTFQNWRAVKLDVWRQECVSRGLLDPEKPKNFSALFSKYRRELIAANLIACNNDLVWLR